jgi:tetratricopeptide (TPR) repeat protein
MKRMIAAGILSLAAGFTLSAQPKAPQPKSKAELEAVQALFKAQQDGPDAIITAADALLSKFGDTEFKEIALYVEAVAYQQKKDPVKAQIFAERVLEINPKNVQATLMIGETIAQSVRENDLDKEEKLTKAEKMLNDTVANAKVMDKPNPQIPDAQWEEQRKYLIAEADNDLGLCSLARKKTDLAAQQFKAAVDLDPQPAYQVRLASALQATGKNDEALAIVEKLLADPQLHPSIKAVANNVKAAATAAKGGK